MPASHWTPWQARPASTLAVGTRLQRCAGPHMAGRPNPILLPMLRVALQMVLAWTPARIRVFCLPLTARIIGVSSMCFVFVATIRSDLQIMRRALDSPHLFGRRRILLDYAAHPS